MLRWLGKTKRCRALWNAQQTDQISSLLLQYNATLPFDFHRRFRSLEHIHFWKGTEFRTIIMYAGIVLFKDFLPSYEYEIFLKLSCAVTICSSKVYKVFYPLARKLFIEYIEGHIDIYGEESVVSNIHNLCHVVDDIEHLGDLSTLGAYPFENALHHMKLVLKQCNKPLEQLVRRIHENGILQKPFCFEHCIFPKFMCPFNYSEDPNRMAFRKVELKSSSTLSNDNKNKWYLSNTNIIAQFEFGFKNDADYFIRGRPLKETKIFFNSPFDSKYLHIFISNCECSESQDFNVKDIKAKMWAIPYGNDYVFLPLLHTF